jgi:hypothetical protein
MRLRVNLILSKTAGQPLPLMNKLITTILILYTFHNAVGQGCSDAGFCTMGAMKPDQPYNKNIPVKLRALEFSVYRGTTTLSPIVYVATLDANFSVFGNKNSIQVKLPYQSVRGNLSNTGGLGDISLCYTRNIISTNKFDVNFSLGGKIPSNNANLKDSKTGLPLPMYYQTSLGSYDLITGISVITRKWLLATGIQHPLNKNENEFVWGNNESGWVKEYKNNTDPEYVRSYNKANNLKRGTDVMVRVERNFRFSRLNFTLGLLPIYRITNDEVEDPATEERFKPKDAKGLALSGIGTVGYNFNVKSGIRLLLGHKIVQREHNPDGLTREMVTTISYNYRF